MNLAKAGLLALSLVLVSPQAVPAPAGGTVSGKVTLSGTAPKAKSIDLSKEPECVKMHASDPLMPETVLVGSGNMLRNVVVYISGGSMDQVPVPPNSVIYDQQGCHYATHVLAFRVGQEVRISNSDPFSHNIHPMAKLNREWNKMQPPGTPPFTYAYEHEEFIHIKCNIHAWMEGYFAVLRTSHFAVTGDDGRFSLPDLPPGHYTITAWHEVYGTQTQEITISGGDSQTINFVFTAKP